MNLYVNPVVFAHPISLCGTHMRLTDKTAPSTDVFKTNVIRIFNTIETAYQLISSVHSNKVCDSVLRVERIVRKLQNKLLDNNPYGYDQDIFLSGNLLLVNEKTCIVDALDVLCLIGRMMGLHYTCSKTERIQEVQEPIHALERQLLVDETKDRWGTIEIITTDSEKIEDWLCFNEVCSIIEHYPGKIIV